MVEVFQLGHEAWECGFRVVDSQFFNSLVNRTLSDELLKVSASFLQILPHHGADKVFLVIFIQRMEDILHNMLNMIHLVDRGLEFRHFSLVFFSKVKHSFFTVLDITHKSIPKLNNNVVNDGLECDDDFIEKIVTFIGKVPDFPVL